MVKNVKASFFANWAFFFFCEKTPAMLTVLPAHEVRAVPKSRDLCSYDRGRRFCSAGVRIRAGKGRREGDEEDTGAPNVTKLDSSLPREASFKRENVLSYARRGFFFIGKGLKPFSVCGMSLSSIAMSRGN